MWVTLKIEHSLNSIFIVGSKVLEVLEVHLGMISGDVSYLNLGLHLILITSKDNLRTSRDISITSRDNLISLEDNLGFL